MSLENTTSSVYKELEDAAREAQSCIAWMATSNVVTADDRAGAKRVVDRLGAALAAVEDN